MRRLRPVRQLRPTSLRLSAIRKPLAAAAVTILATLGLALPAVLQTAPAAAAATGTFAQVSDFGSNPGGLQMYMYVPASLPADPPVVVALHGCTQSATIYYDDSGWAAEADAYGFIVVFPQQTAANNAEDCFDWWTPSADSRGEGEAESIYQMTEYAISTYSANAAKVYITGLSAGGAMTSDMLADYPDVYAGGAIIGGIPVGCATSLTQADTCMAGPVSNSPSTWASYVTGADPGYTGPYPRVAIWYGTDDTVVNPANATESMDQWTSVWGLSQTPSSTSTIAGDSSANNDDVSDYGGTAAAPDVQLNAVQGVGHGTPVATQGTSQPQCGAVAAYFVDSVCSSYYIAQFWGLTTASSSPPPTTAAPAATTTAATSVASTTATVNGSVNPNGLATTYSFEYGTTTAYGTTTSSVSAGSGTSATTVSASLTGLSPGTTYDVQLVAQNADGTTGGGNITFTTPAAAPLACYTASNYQLTVDGYAYEFGGYTYADGSNDYLGLWNVFYTSSLEETSPGYFVSVSSCP